MRKIADTVENATNGKPLQNAVVSLTISGVAQPLYLTNDVGGTVVYSVLTDADGYYEFYAPDGAYTFKATYGDTTKTIDDFEVYDESEQRAAVVALQSAVAALPTFASGSYTPTLTNISNMAAYTSQPVKWTRQGDQVWFAGRVDIDPTAATFTDIYMDLPVATDFSDAYQCNGVIATNAVAGGSGIIKSDPTTNQAIISFAAPGTASQPMSYFLKYTVI
jgi:hypothetical protein